MINRSKATDAVSILLIVVSYLLPEPYHHILLLTGLFALSGAITNQIAIYMLFNRVPFLYGSGVIEKNFDSFKHSIKSMIMEQFFTAKNLNEFFKSEEKKIDLAPLIESVDFSVTFDVLKQSVMESKFGSMVQMIGGENALEPLRETFSKKLNSAVVTIVRSESFKAQFEHHMVSSSLSSDMIESIDRLISKRLDEMSPNMVKELVKSMIQEHMGWLVVWGGAFGACIGFISSFAV